MIKAAFFDLDGTLVNTLNGLCYTMNLVMKEFGFDEISREQTKQYIGYGYHKFTELSLKATSDRLYKKAEKMEHKNKDMALELEMQADDVMAAYDDACEAYLKAYAANYLHDSAPYDGMVETLDTLRKAGIKLAVVTNKPLEATMKTLDQTFGENYFDYVVCDDGKVPVKPDPTGCRMAMEALDVKPSEVIYMGDTKTDMVTACNAGLIPVGCLYGFRDKKELVDNGARYLIKEPKEILGIVDGLNKA